MASITTLAINTGDLLEPSYSEDEKDLRDDSDNYWSVAGDLAFMWPMIEMSGLEHFKFIDEVLYVYNESNPINDHKVDFSKVRNTHTIISNKTPYKKI